MDPHILDQHFPLQQPAEYSVITSPSVQKYGSPDLVRHLRDQCAAGSRIRKEISSTL